METATLTLTDFLLARFAEDEAVARAASGDRWDRLSDGDPKFRKVVAWGLTPIGAMNAEQDADHIARHDPARALAEVETKRRTLALLDEVGERGIPRLTIYTRDLLPRLLALPYASHPDYDESWRP
jgi:hypothetical protein